MAEAGTEGEPINSLAPVGVQTTDDQLLTLVSQLRARLSDKLPPGTSLWGADLLDGSDPRSTHILAKCVAYAEPGCPANDKFITCGT